MSTYDDGDTGYIMQYLIFLTPILAMLGNLVLPVLLLIMGGLAATKKITWTELSTCSLLLPAAISIILMLSCLFGIKPTASFMQLFKLIVIIFCGFLLYYRTTPDIMRWISPACAIMLFIAIIEITIGATVLNLLKVPNQDPYKLEYFNRSASFMAIFLWLAVGWHMQRNEYKKAYAFIATGMLVLLFMHAEAATLAFFTGIIAYIMLSYWKKAYVLIACANLFSLLALPLLMPFLWDLSWLHNMDYLKSWWHRVYIWTNVLDLIYERPLFGWGFHSSSIMSSFHTGHITPIEGKNLDLLPCHPHNASLQMLLEMGIAGLAIYSAFWTWLIITIAKNPKMDYNTKNILLTIIVVYSVINLFSFSLWISWWVSGFMITFVLALRGLNKT